jgi:hypothetical protein
LFGFFSTASILDVCGDLGYLLINQLEKRQIRGQEAEKMKIEGERKKGLVWAAAEARNLGLGLYSLYHLHLVFILGRLWFYFYG